MQHDLKTTELQIAGIIGALAPDQATDIAWACVWLEACGYPGLKLLVEGLGDRVHRVDLSRDVIGIDLHNVSCVFLAPAIMREVEAGGRVFLRNVRHGLYLLPFTVRNNIGIGCPVDPAFAVGGERAKNPYADKLALAEDCGLALDEGLWSSLMARA